MPAAPEERLTTWRASSATGGQYVLYVMNASRRLHDNFALEHAVERARSLGKPLLLLEPLPLSAEGATMRSHRWVSDGMLVNARAARRHGVAYVPWIETESGQVESLLGELAERAALCVFDDPPSLRERQRLIERVSSWRTPVEAVDGVGLLPLRGPPREFLRAVDFRRCAHRLLPGALARHPMREPLAGYVGTPLDGAAFFGGGLALPERLARLDLRWLKEPARRESLLRALPLDFEVGAVSELGGAESAEGRLHRFLSQRLAHYAEQRNLPALPGTSELSADLHFGHLSAHRVFAELARLEDWSPEVTSPRKAGRREGWWQLSPPAEAFVEQLVTWRELSCNGAHWRADFHRYESLPAWARATLAKHRADPREPSYSLGQLEAAETGDALWNAAQRQLRGEGRIHNALRMLWGKKVLQWSPSPEEAFERLVFLNDRWALDGRDPNSYSGIGWCFGRYDRPWGPQRPIYGTVRYMTSENARRKWKTGPYEALWLRP